MRTWARIGFWCVICSISFAAEIHGQSRRVVSYIDEVQDERRSNRWTLTEWLRIKERMKMMDIWAAMFSDPRKGKFSPELSLQYGQGRGLTEFRVRSAQTDSLTQTLKHSSEQGRLQFWFTNLVSSSTGLRTLDIDLGLESSFSNRFAQEAISLLPASESPLTVGTERLQKAGINFRLFGANVQDSFLLAKVGKFSRYSGLKVSPLAEDSHGNYYGAEMAFYLMPFLGIEGEYLKLLAANRTETRSSAHYYNYNVFFEVINIRILAGRSEQSFSQEASELQVDSKDSSQSLSLRLYF
jgi:hypothetical protein